jgi:uncharacterized protein YyaL (SSP411 family)
MVSSYLKAYEVLGHEEARDFGLKTLDFILEHSSEPAASLYHSYLEGERRMPGLLDDQVMIARALLDAYEVTGEPRHLAQDREIMEWSIKQLWDAKGGGFFDSKPDLNAVGLLATPRKEVQDNPSTSGNAAAAQVLNRLFYLTQENRYRDYARRTIEAFAGAARDFGTFVAALGIAAEEHLEYPTTAVVIGERGDSEAELLHRAALTAFRPGKIVMQIEPNRVDRKQLPAVVTPILDSIGPERWPLAFVCTGTVCAPPTNKPTDVTSLVKTFGLQQPATPSP